MSSSPVLHTSVATQVGFRTSIAGKELSPTYSAEAMFCVVYERYRRRLFRIALRIMKNEADAEDVLQESLLRAYSKVEYFRGDAAIYTWLVRIVINTSLMSLRKSARHPHTSLDCEPEGSEPWADSLPSSGVSVEAEVIRGQLAAIMLHAIDDLPPHFKALLSTWLAKDPTLEELSSEFELSLSATKSRIYRSKQIVANRVRRRLRLSPAHFRYNRDSRRSGFFLNLSYIQHINTYVRTY